MPPSTGVKSADMPVAAHPGLALGDRPARQEAGEAEVVAVQPRPGEPGPGRLEHHLEGLVGGPHRADPPAGLTCIPSGRSVRPIAGPRSGPRDRASRLQITISARQVVVSFTGYRRRRRRLVPRTTAPQRGPPAERARVQLGGETGPVVVAPGLLGLVGGLRPVDPRGLQADRGQPARAAQHHRGPVEPAAADREPGEVGVAGDRRRPFSQVILSILVTGTRSAARSRSRAGCSTSTGSSAYQRKPFRTRLDGSAAAAASLTSASLSASSGGPGLDEVVGHAPADGQARA